jgi:hypothetical protein
MMASAQEFLEREAASWDAFEAQVDRVPTEQREVPGVVEGWSVKDVVWHCVYWARYAADHVVMEGDGPFTDPFAAHPDGYWDGVNAEIAEASSAMSWDDVWEGAADARASVRSVVTRPGLPSEPIDFAAEESWVHYDEHAEHVRAFADALG